MKKSLCFATLSAAAALIVLPVATWAGTPQPPADRVELTAAGSGVNLGITRLLAEAFTKRNPGIHISVPGSVGTRGAIKATAEGAISLGLISRGLEKEEADQGLIAKPYARVPIVIAAHPTVKDAGITSAELVEIYKGTKTRWRDGNTIIVLAREKSDSGFLILQNKIPGFKEAYLESQQASRWTILYNDQDANQALVKTSYAIGVTDLGMIKTEHLDVKVLKLDGVLAAPELLVKGRYPLERTLAFIYRDQNLTKETKAFLDFVGSATGQTILKANGFLPVK